MELASFTARIYASREPIEEDVFVVAPDERRIELSRIDTDEGCSKIVRDKAAREMLRIHPPEWEDAAFARPGEERLAVAANVLQEEIAESDLFHTVELSGRQSAQPTLLVKVVRTAGRNCYDNERQRQFFGLPLDQSAANAVHAHALVLGCNRCDERSGLDTVQFPQSPQRERGVFAPTPGERESAGPAH